MRKSVTKSETDWKRVRQNAAANAPIAYDTADGPYDPNDAKATAKYLASATVRRRGQRGPQKAPTKELVSLRLSPEIVQFFKGQGKGWQTRINNALLKVVNK